MDGEAECSQPVRTGEPWEASEGGIYLLRELSTVLPEKVPEFLPPLAELVSRSLFTENQYSIIPHVGAQYRGSMQIPVRMQSFADTILV